MGIAVEYSGQGGKPRWNQPDQLVWDYFKFAGPLPQAQPATDIPLVFESRFAGHGAMDRWTINGRSYPDTETVTLQRGQRYRLVFKNQSKEDHPLHLHRHLFEVATQYAKDKSRGIRKDTVLVSAGTEMPVTFTADNPGLTLLHCHQQDHMDAGFMMLLRYA